MNITPGPQQNTAQEMSFFATNSLNTFNAEKAAFQGRNLLQQKMQVILKGERRERETS